MRIDLNQPAKTAQPTQPQTIIPPLKSNEVNLQSGDPIHLLHKRAIEYATKFKYKPVPSLQEALLGRQEGHLVLSYREADIAARGVIDLSKQIIKCSILLESWFLTEGIPGVADSPWELRSFYNRGVHFFKSGKSEHVDHAARERARLAMVDVQERLKGVNLPAWPEELTDGFVMELCKPDYMTWDQYRAKMKNPITMDDPYKQEVGDAQ